MFKAFDPGDVLNLYESAAGYSLAGLRCFAWAFFMIACTTTIKKFPEKRQFYFPFGVLGSIWIISGPILIFMIVGLLDPWVNLNVKQLNLKLYFHFLLNFNLNFDIPKTNCRFGNRWFIWSTLSFPLADMLTSCG